MGLSEEITKNSPSAFHLLPSEEVAIEIYKNILQMGSTAISEHSFEFIPRFLSDKSVFNNDDIVICFRCALYTINYLSTEDPSKLHYQAAKEALKENRDENLAANEKARDLLAREIVNECNSLALKIIPTELLQENVAEEGKGLFIISQKNEKADHLIVPINGKLWLDNSNNGIVMWFGPTFGIEAVTVTIP